MEITYQDLIKGVEFEATPKEMYSPTHHLTYNRGTIFDWSVFN